MPTPTPMIPAQRVAPIWEARKLFREPQYENGVQWPSGDETSDDDTLGGLD